MPKEYVEYCRRKVGNRTRVLYKKKNSRSDNPVLYIMQNEEYVPYKSFLNDKKKKKMRGGDGELQAIYDGYKTSDDDAKKYIIDQFSDLFRRIFNENDKEVLLINDLRKELEKITEKEQPALENTLNGRSEEDRSPTGGRPKPSKRNKKFIKSP